MSPELTGTSLLDELANLVLTLLRADTPQAPRFLFAGARSVYRGLTELLFQIIQPLLALRC